MTLTAPLLGAAIAAIAVAAPLQAFAQEGPAGGWAFWTEELPDSCSIRGDMTVKPTRSPGRFSCVFVAVQSCTQRLPREIRTSQSCTLSQAGGQVSIMSRVERIDAVDPPEQAAGMADRYAPDNFVVSPAPGWKTMTGVFLSWGRVQSAVTFERREEKSS